MKTGPRTDLSGQRFGRLVVLGLASEKTGRSYLWNVRCDCGTEKEVCGSRLRTGRTKSCGCLLVESGIRVSRSQSTHGHCENGTTKTYRSWRSMHQRCRDKGDRSYENYGGAGISVCERWFDFAAFLADMGERPPGKTLDRFPNRDGNYEPGNCRWATPREQVLNRAATVWVEIEGQRRCVRDWSQHYGLSEALIRYRVNKGWGLVAAITTPKGNHRNGKQTQ